MSKLFAIIGTTDHEKRILGIAAEIDMRDRCGMSAAVIAGKLGRSRSSVLGVFKRIADDEAAAEAPREAAE